MRKYNPPRMFGGKRLYRKKWHLGEFSEYGFEFEAKEPKSECDSALFYTFIEFIEELGLEVGGSFSPSVISGYISAVSYRKNPTVQDQKKIREFLERYYEKVVIGKFQNSWYDKLPCHYKGE